MSTKKSTSTKKAATSTKSESAPATKTPAPRRGQKALRWQDPHLERERAKYGQAMPSREFILQLLTEAGGPLDSEEFAVRLDIEPDEMDAFNIRLRAMQRDGQIVINRRGALCLPDKIDVKNGRVEGHHDGFGFFIPDDKSGDMFIHEKEMRGVLHGDRVMVREHGVDRRGRKEGKIVEVLARVNTHLVGRLYRERGYQWVVAENRRISQDILIPDHADMGASTGQVVMTEIVEQPTKHAPPVGKITKILGRYADPGMEIEIALRKHSLPHDFPPEVSAVAKKLPKGVLKKDLGNGREDIRDLPLVTIDGEDARDFDDAVYCRPEGRGYRLWVAIADVSHYVQPGTPLDKEAFDRGNSVYFPRRVIPMLPEELSNGLCSLNPGVDRLCMVCEMEISSFGNIKKHRFYTGVMHSKARLTYNQVWDWLSGSEPPADQDWVLPHLQSLHKLFKVLLKARVKRGAIDFETVETQMLFDANDKIERIVPSTRNEAHRLIEECMLAANVCASEYLQKRKHAALYRVHEGPTPEKLKAVHEFLAEFGFFMTGGDDPQAKDYADLLLKIKGRPDEQLLQTVLLRSLRQAVYSPENAGHFGLAYEAYTHFTSPIRRYPDLLVHRAIKACLKNETYNPGNWENVGIHCSMTERRADDATRDVVAWLKCFYMQDKINEEFDGVISAVVSFGVFVALHDVFVEGLIHVTELGQDYFHFDAARHQMLGERTGKRFRLGDKVRISVVQVDIESSRIDFALVDTSPAADDTDVVNAKSGGPKPAASKSKPKSGDKSKAKTPQANPSQTKASQSSTSQAKASQAKAAKPADSKKTGGKGR